MTKILVVEDEVDLRDNLQEFLQLKKFTTITAEDGFTGLQCASAEMPDLILCDVTMPNLDGYQMLEALRRDPKTAIIPVILLTAKDNYADIRQGMQLGADDYLVKPFQADELLSAIASRLAKQAQVQQQLHQMLDELRYCISTALPHEFNTPLNGIMGMTELLIEQHDLIGQTEGLEIAETIHDAAIRLQKTTQNFLLYTNLELIARVPQRLEQFQRTAQQSVTQPTTVLMEVASGIATRRNRGSDLTLQLQNSLVAIDEKNLKKIAEELIDNAFKFSQSGAPVTVATSQFDRYFYLYITDAGRGMTAEQIARAGAYIQFERQYYEQQGSGLGLVIAKRLIELHGGELSISSTPGQQTHIQVCLPAVGKIE